MAADPAAISRTAVTTDQAPAPAGPYSQGVVANGMLYTTGQLSLDPSNGRLITATITHQTRRILENLSAICAAAGTDLRSAALLTVYTIKPTAVDEIDAAFGEFFDDAPPARVIVGVTALPLPPMCWVQIQAVVPVP